ncbi:MAG: 2Fe-2S iron-sulfur cluster-binding protein [Cyanobacteria bacterium P01_D01_bin.105]
MTTVQIHFLPDDVTTTAEAGESWLAVAARAGVQISTGCLAGSCHACEIEIAGEAEPVLACLQSVPSEPKQIEVKLFSDPTW